MGTKLRIYRVAKEFDVANDTLINFLKEKNYDVRNHMSPVSGEMYAELQKKFRKKEVQETEYDFRKSLKDKQVRESARKAEEQRLLQERLKAATQFSEERAAQKAESKHPEEKNVAVAKSDVTPKEKNAHTHRSVETFVSDKHASADVVRSSSAPKEKPGTVAAHPKAKAAPKVTAKTTDKVEARPASGTTAAKTGDNTKKSPATGKKPYVKPAYKQSEGRYKKPTGTTSAGKGTDRDKPRSAKPGGSTDKKYTPHRKKPDDNKDKRQGSGSTAAKKPSHGSGNKNFRDTRRNDKKPGTTSG
ncbi:translation initiation factor IF-2 N-terminal domain-containing protein, partial [bacterium]|nr:translation initiation factor IF-2 N-terminal domain-containing protein [bacterium]